MESGVSSVGSSVSSDMCVGKFVEFLGGVVEDVVGIGAPARFWSGKHGVALGVVGKPAGFLGEDPESVEFGEDDGYLVDFAVDFVGDAFLGHVVRDGRLPWLVGLGFDGRDDEGFHLVLGKSSELSRGAFLVGVAALDAVGSVIGSVHSSTPDHVPDFGLLSGVDALAGFVEFEFPGFFLELLGEFGVFLLKFFS